MSRYLAMSSGAHNIDILAAAFHLSDHPRVASRTDLRVIVGIRHQISRLNGRKISDQLLNMTIVE